jgi:hypothetical protein
MVMRFPLVLSAHGDVLLFRNVEDLESYVEPIDVEHEEYVAFDSEGHRLALGISRRRRRVVLGLLEHETPVVSVERSQDQPLDDADLRRVLVDFLVKLGTPRESLPSSLEKLVAEAVARVGFAA